MHGAIEELGKNMKSVFPEILMFAAMETAENSQLTISVYADKDAADRAVLKEMKQWKAQASLIYLPMKVT